MRPTLIYGSISSNSARLIARPSSAVRSIECLRVIRFGGGPFHWLDCFERFVGYAQIPATLFTALLDFWRDPNRRLPHDRLSGM